MTPAQQRIADDVAAERDRQDAKWGPQDSHPDGTGGLALVILADMARDQCERESKTSAGSSWRSILLEEVFEACAEIEPDDLRKELIQVQAVAMHWVEALDAR